MRSAAGFWISLGVLAGGIAGGVSPASAQISAPGQAVPAPPPPDPGPRLVSDLGCAVCHDIPDGETGIRTEAPDLTYEGEIVRPEWLFDFLRAPRSIRPAVRGRMPNFRLTDEEALALTEYLRTRRDDAPPVPARFRFTGKIPPEHLEAARKLTSPDYLDCFKCHVLGQAKPAGKPEEWAPDLTRARERLNPDYIIKWLANPQKFRPESKMPAFFPDKDSGPEDVLDGDEERQIAALRDWLMSVGREGKAGAYGQATARLPGVSAADGRSLMVKLNCVGCHEVGGLPDGKKIGPSLVHEGSRVQRDWLIEFLKRPRTIKPEYALMGSPARMPDFRLSDAEAATLADYIARAFVDRDAPTDGIFAAGIPPALIERGARLFAAKRCDNCHRIGAKPGGIGPDLTETGKRLRAGWTIRFIQRPSHYLDTRMPNLQVSEEEAQALAAYLLSPKGEAARP